MLVINGYKKIPERRSYSKSRLIIVVAFGIFILFSISEVIINNFIFSSDPAIQFSGCNPCKTKIQVYKEYLEFSLLLIAVFLFALNKKITDYISFVILVFLIGGVLPVTFIEGGCLESENFYVCIKDLFLILLIVAAPLVYLTINFVKNIGK